MKKIRLLILSFIMIFILFVQVSLGFFDNNSINDQLFVPIGVWTTLDDPATPETVKDYLETLDTIIETRPNMESADIADYLQEILFEENEEGEQQLDEIFADYTLGEIIETIDLIIEFTEAFLVFDKDNNPVFPNPQLVDAVNIDLGGPLNPGEYRIVNKVIQTANLSNIHWWSPIALQLTMEDPLGGDISDYVIEVLFDARPYDENAPFSYNYLIRDKTSWNNNRARDEIDIDENQLVPVAYDVVFNSVVYRDKGDGFVPVNYRHMYAAPQFTGNWSRLPIGPNIYLGPPTGEHDTPIGSQQEILRFDNPSRRAGLVLIGKANGTRSELRIDIPERNPRNGDSVPLMPVAIVVSRGLELDGNGNPLPTQSDLMIEPLITMRVIEGQVWTGD